MGIDSNISVDSTNIGIMDPVEHIMKEYFNSPSTTYRKATDSSDKDTDAADIDRQIKESQQMLMALTADYVAVYMIDPIADRADVLKLDGRIKARVSETPTSFSYSKLFKAYAANRILEEDREGFLSAVMTEALISRFSKERDKHELNFRIFADGRQQHYSGLFIRISKQEEPLRLIAGFRNIDDVIDIQKQTRNEGIYSAYTAVSDAYLSMHRVNVKKNTYSEIKTTDAIRRFELQDSNCFDDNVRSIIKGLAKEESYKTALDFLDITTLSERMKGRIHITTRFEGRIAGSCRFHFFKENDDAEGNLEHVIFAVEVTDEDKFQSVFDVLARGFQNVFWINPCDGTARILKLDGYVTKGLEKENHKYNSFSYEVLLKQYIKDRVYEEDRQYLYDKLNIDKLREMFADRDEYIGNYRVLIDGSIHHYQFSYSRISNTDYLVAGFQNIDSIIEEHIEAEKKERAKEEAHQREMQRQAQEHQQQLALALEAAQQASRAKSTFLNSMSHDIRTPMNAIIGFTSLAQAHIDEQKKVQDYLSKISTSSSHLLSLINDILDMSRIESGTVKLDEKPVHMPEMLDDLHTMLQGLVNDKNQNLSIDMQDVVHEDVITDKLRLNQVLINIAGNAVKFTQPGGNIAIRLTEKPCDLKDCTTYQFSVRDNGIGMSKEFLGHIFDTFSREHNSTVSGIQGTGLGMAITKNIVDMMGGDIQVESEEGKGSVFTVTLNMRLAEEPVSAKTLDKALTADTAVSHSTSDEDAKQEDTRKHLDYRGKRVLLAEDNELNREIATALLEEMGLEVDSVDDGDVAVAAIDKSAAGRYDLVLMDIQMPKMDGYTATREIRTLRNNKKANIPIVAMTANAFYEDRQKAFASGMNGHIIKPIDMKAIARTLDAIFGSQAGK